MMEGSTSSMGKAVVSNIINEEESGWTAYFEDFSNNHRERETDEEESFCNSGFFGTSSMVSDAASFPAWKSSSHHHHSSSIQPSSKLPNKLNFKKTRAKEISFHDDSLEDTASSPANSPKVSCFRPTTDDHIISSSKPVDHFNSSLGKGGNYEQVVEAENELDYSCNNNNNHCTGLKKRGLCLVPVSMLVNYLG